MPSPFDQELRRELSPGEELLWWGSPRPGLRLRRTDALLLPASLPLVAFAWIWEASAIRSAPPFFALFGSVLVASVAYTVVGRFFVDAWIRGRTVYGVTGERALILGGVSRREVKSRSLTAVGELALREAADGSGTLTFGPHPFPFAWFEGMPWPGAGQVTPFRFELIDNVRQVYEVIRTAQRKQG